MARSRKDRKKAKPTRPDRGGDESGDEEAPSVGGGSSVGNDEGGEQGAASSEQVLEEGMELVLEKRAASRVKGLRALARTIRQEPGVAPWVASNQAGLSSAVCGAFRKGATSEVVEGCRLLSAAVISMGEDNCLLYRDARPHLIRILSSKKAKNAAAVGAAAARALSVSCFVSDTGDIEGGTEEIMGLLASTFAGAAEAIDASGDGGGENDDDAADDNDDGDDDDDDDDDSESDSESSDSEDDEHDGDKKNDLARQVASCLRGWGLLASTVTKAKQRHAAAGLEATLVSLLSHDDVHVRAAAGADLALLSESLQRRTLAAERCERLARDGGRRLGKHYRRQQRAAFREIAATLSAATDDEDAQPEQTIKVHTNKYTVRGWPAVLRLRVIKAVLASGFMSHLAGNELLSAMFGVSAFHDAQVAVAKDDLREMKDDQIYESGIKARARFEADKKRRKQKRAHQFAEDED